MGAAFWGRFYLAGAGCFALAPLMLLDLAWSPLELGLLLGLTLTSYGLHLRTLSR